MQALKGKELSGEERARLLETVWDLALVSIQMHEESAKLLSNLAAGAEVI